MAQPIESRVVGVDDMLYMKSTSGADGSYTLTVTFAVGTDPDIATVNVQNRVSLATAGPAAGGQRRPASACSKQSSALLQVIAIYRRGREFDALFLSNYATINVIDALKRVPGVGDASLFGAADYAMRIDPRRRPDDEPRADAGRRRRRAAGAERAGGDRPDRRAADDRRPAVPAQHRRPRAG